jgi:hypothetical protein
MIVKGADMSDTPNLEDLRIRYRGLPGQKAYGEVDDGTGLIGFYNPVLCMWEWWRWNEKKHGYVMTGSTLSVDS